jgi:thiamine kinase-like enzyme
MNLNRDIVSKKLEVSDELIRNLDQLNILKHNIKKFYNIEFSRYFFPNSYSFTAKKVIIQNLKDKKFYFLKCKPQYASDCNSLRISALFQNEVNKSLGLAPSIINTLSGNNFAFWNESYFFLTEFIAGKEYTADMLQARNVVICLAQIHKLGLTIKHDFTCPPIQLHNTNLGLEQSVLKLNFKNDNLAQNVFYLLKKLNIENKLSNPSCIGLIHGDPAPFNIVFSDNNQVQVFNDFDNCCFGEIIQDLAACILSFSGINYYANTSSLNIPIQTKLNIDMAHLMLKDYISENQDIKNDLRLLGNALILSWVELMYLGMLRGDFEPKDILNAQDFVYNIRDSVNQILNNL